MNHFKISLIKSLIRIFGSILGVIFISSFGTILFMISFGLAEVLGIFEEIFDKRKEK